MSLTRANVFELTDEGGHENSGVAREAPTRELIDHHLLSCPKDVAFLTSKSRVA